ncbi:hypothetical protein TURU_083031 [Turdus rufiventris]|nr:hypothetical protein TURU_083031 [Turdus rufiventris]
MRARNSPEKSRAHPAAASGQRRHGPYGREKAAVARHLWPGESGSTTAPVAMGKRRRCGPCQRGRNKKPASARWGRNEKPGSARTGRNRKPDGTWHGRNGQLASTDPGPGTGGRRSRAAPASAGRECLGPRQLRPLGRGSQDPRP